jgi:hypothetical protein
MTLEPIHAREYLASRDADSVEQMSLEASRLSRALSVLGVRHRFEVCDGQDAPALYPHHLWPQQEGP